MTLRLSETELQALQNKRALWKKLPEKRTTVGVMDLLPRKKSKGMNGLESEFAASLDYRKHEGEITWWGYEPFRIRLADGCFYRPDFAAVDAQGRTSIYECKGHMREAARVRLRVAAEKLPYPFYLVRKHKGQLQVTPI